MVPVPVGEVDQLDRRDFWSQSLDVPLPYILFWARVEEHRVSFVSFYGCLRWHKLLSKADL